MQKPLIFETTTAGKLPGTSFRTQTQEFFEVLATLQSGAQRPEGVKKDMMWRKTNADGSWEIYIAGDTEQSDIVVFSSLTGFSETAEIGRAPVAIEDEGGNAVFDQTVKDAMVGGVRKQSATTPNSSESVTFEIDSKQYYARAQMESGSSQLTFTDGETESVKISAVKGFFMSSLGGTYGWVVPQARTSSTAGVLGYFSQIYTDSSAYNLPEGGVWEYMCFNYNSDYTISIASFRIGVSAGGTVLPLQSGFRGLIGYIRRIL